MRKITPAGKDLLKTFEGCRLRSYQDQVGVWTIGYGHTGEDVHSAMRISQERADELLDQDLLRFEGAVEYAARTVPLTDNQFSALVSLAYNIGTGAFLASTLLKRLLAKKYDMAADNFLRWDHTNGKVNPGLSSRRAKERELFLTEDAI